MSIGLDTSVVLRLLTGVPAKLAEAAHAIAALLDDPRVQCTGVARRVFRDATAGAMPLATPGLMDRLILENYRAEQCTVVTFDRELVKADGAQLVGARP
jgi:predicted nucleic acid-binding protein